MSLAHFSHFSLTTEMDSSLVLNFAFPCGLRGFQVDFDLNEGIDFYDLSHKCPIVVVKGLNTLICQSFSS